MAKTVEEVQVHERAVDVQAEISAIVRRDSFRRDPRLRAQVLASSERISALIVEGWAQSSDQAAGHFLYRSRAAVRETLAHVVVMAVRRHVTTAERSRIAAKLEELAKLLTHLIARTDS